MVRLIIQAVLTILGNAIGLIVARLLLTDFSLSVSGFIYSVLFFTLVETLLSPFVLKMAIKYLPALRGGIALVTCFVALLLTTIFTNSLQISGIQTWLIAPFIVWTCTIISGVLLPLVLFKKTLQQQSISKNS